MGSAVLVVKKTGAPQLVQGSVQGSVLEPVLERVAVLGPVPGLCLSSIPVPVA